MDVRIKKTIASLSEAFYQLLKEKNFETITVSEICQLAGIRRATFYKHFSDKASLFAYVMRNQKEQFYQCEKLLNINQPIEEFTKTFIDYIFMYTSQNRDVIYHIINSTDYTLLLGIIIENMTADFMEVITREASQNRVFVASPRTLAAMLTSSLVYTHVQWYKSSKTISEALIRSEMNNVALRILS